eukprot:3555403-Rhodomonas_salina.1
MPISYPPPTLCLVLWYGNKEALQYDPKRPYLSPYQIPASLSHPPTKFLLASYGPMHTSYQPPTRCPVLTSRMVLPGGVCGESGGRRGRGRGERGVGGRGRDARYRQECRVSYPPTRSYAMSGTEIAYGAMRCLVLKHGAMLCAYARATRCPVLRQRMVRPGVT